MNTMTRTQILMCPPEHFEVDYVINPWMEGNVDAASPELARAQWRVLRDAIASVATVVELPPVKGLPDMVFTANAATVCGDRAVVSNFFHPQRQGESAHFAGWFRAQGFAVLELPQGMVFEGAGDSLIHRGGDWIWAAYGQRTDLASHAMVSDWLGWELVSLRLVDPYFYHLDTCLCPLADGYLMYWPKAFDAAANCEIEHRVPAHKRIEVSDSDAAQFACNAVNVGEHVFMNRASNPLRGKLARAGFTVHEVDLSEFLKSGGSAKCLTLKLTEPERPMAADRASA